MDTNDDQPTTAHGPLSPLQAGVLAEIRRFERDQAAELNAPTTTTVHNLAQSYDRIRTDAGPERAAADRATVAAEVAADISLAEAGTIRRAAKAVELGTVGIIDREHAQGTSVAAIARELGVTTSYVRRVIRDINRAEQAAAEANGYDWHPPTTTTD